jgi:ABC-type molybdate transport system ATPase subunit
MLERLPALPLADLKAGDQVAVSSTKGPDPARVTAVVLLAGIEPLLQSRPGTASGGETLGLAAGALDIGLGVP